ncbi:MAG: DUF2066 domain-containing protein [Pseudomonadales bacterium]|jgi:hypothetical protein|nr:DUF2066 domain-containing protein [Pseudomonadales bacterium]
MLAEATRSESGAPFGVAAARARLLEVLATCVVLAAVASPWARAAEPTPEAALWRVAVPVADQGSASRREAEREAFGRLLVRISGRDSVLAVPALQAALRTPQRYYTASGYARRDALERREDPDDRPWLLQIEFDAGAVTALLAGEGVPVWTSRRPEFVVWVLAEDPQGQRRLIGAEDPIGALLLARARERGLEVFLPSLDLTDLATFPLAQAWAGFGDAIDRASRRYGSENALTLRLYPDPLGRWLADWSGVIAGATVSGALEVADPAAGAQAALDAVADTLADRFAVSVDTSAGVGSLWLQVDRIDAVDRYAGLMRYLDGIDGVVDVQLVQMQGTSLLLRVDVSDDTRRLLDLLRVEGRLLPEEVAERVGGVGVWRARWSGTDR